MRAGLLTAVAILSVLAGGCDFLTPASTGSPPAANPAASGLPPNPQGLRRWDKLPVHYCLDLVLGGFVSDDAFARMVDRAFTAWGVTAVDDGDCRSATREDDSRNEIGWGVLPVQAGRRVRAFEAGLTLSRATDCGSCSHDGEMQEADIIIDRNAPSPFRTQACLYSTLLHETGHFLGLDHLAAPAIMAASHSDCPQSLTAADRNAIADRYGTASALR